mmetsp:Transcript_9086/g.27322  ORF Transcript_9086/g.27322 Transcript_9086/m.27322 type:complete len:163 (+) Transcript_9086:313-801(+)
MVQAVVQRTGKKISQLSADRAHVFSYTRAKYQAVTRLAVIGHGAQMTASCCRRSSETRAGKRAGEELFTAIANLFLGSTGELPMFVPRWGGCNASRERSTTASTGERPDTAAWLGARHQRTRKHASAVQLVHQVLPPEFPRDLLCFLPLCGHYSCNVGMVEV